MENNSTQLQQALWNSADVLRSKMDASKYKNYLLGFVFYKYLSDKQLVVISDELGEKTTNLQEAQRLYEEAWADEDTKADLLEEIKDRFYYIIKPELTFTSIIKSIDNATFQVSDLVTGFREIEKSDEKLDKLFEDVNLDSTELGTTPQKRNETISKVLKKLDEIDMSLYDGDALGDAYEYLIGQFAKESGKKAGEFYTPQEVSRLMTQIVMLGKEDVRGFSVYDATAGSGSLLLNAKRYSKIPNSIKYFGQELNTSTYNLARMNMILHNVSMDNQHLHNADTLDKDWPDEEPTTFDAVLMNPPYSAKWGAEKGFLEDQRFSPYGVLAPKSKADFAFLLHGFYHLKADGVMAIVLPHGILFRGNAEGKIRTKLLEQGAIDTVIGLPANIFTNTSIPTTVVILKKNRDTRDVLFIDASQEFVKEKTQNKLTEKHIEKILNAYKERKDVEKYAHVASFEEIKENDYNLNIPRYVDTFEEEEPVDVVALSKEMIELNAEIKKVEMEFLAMLDELEITDSSREIIEATKAVFSND